MNVYQVDSSDEGDGGFEQLSAPQVVSEPTPEPVKRESVKQSAEQPSDVSDVLKKWSKKG
jgi:hypothetical protein